MSLEELSEDARARYLARLAALPLSERLRIAFDTSATARAFMEAGLRLRYPEASPRELQARVAAAQGGVALALRLYGIDLSG